MIVFMLMVVMVFLFLVFVVMSVEVCFLFLFFGNLFFDFANPSGRGGCPCEVEEMGVDELVQFHVAIVTFDDFRSRLEGMDDVTDALPFGRFHFRGLVQQHKVAEFYLLDDKVLDVFFADVLAGQVVAAGKFTLQAECVDNGYDAVQFGCSIACVGFSHARDGADGLRNRFRLADTAGFDDDVVEAVHLQDIVQLFHQVHLQGAADASVLERYQAVVFLAHDASFLDKVGIDVHFTDVVHDDGELDAPFVGKDVVYQGCFPATQITGQE